MPVRIQFFGAPQVLVEGRSVPALQSNRLQSLLAYLVLRSSTPQPREQLAALLWPESDEGQARTNLRQLLHHLRKALPPGAGQLTAGSNSVQWTCGPSCEVDVSEFDEARRLGAGARGRRDAAEEARALECAAGLYQDELARGVHEDWIAPLREQYRQEFAEVLERLSALYEEGGNLPSAIRAAERLVAHDSLRDAYHRSLIRLHLANHDRAGALRAYHQCMRVMRRELGVEPDPATRELYQKALKSAAPATTEARVRSPKSATPIVGRAPEWEQLQELWRQVEGGHRHLAVIVGEPGIGKSRLAEEMIGWCNANSRGTAARARCYSAQGQLAFAPVAEWLRAPRLGTGISGLSQVQLTQLARVLPELQAGWSEAPPSVRESWERRRFVEALCASFRGAVHPLLLVLDDLQWSDLDTIEFLEVMIRSGQAGNLLVVATMRPEETDRSHPANRLRAQLAASGQASEIPLLPLSAEETAELATQLAGAGLTAADLPDLYSMTKGNPLFVVEVLRAGLHSADAARRIHAVIGARLSQLSPGAYELAGWAALAGQSFTPELLAKASDWDDDSVSRAMDELWQRRLIESIGGPEYDFTHDRIREVALAGVSPVRRRFLHRRLARALEELHPNDTGSLSKQVAAHYDEAGLPEEAIAAYRRAAAAAQERFADRESAELLRRALVLCARLAESSRRDHVELELSVLLGRVLVVTVGYAMPEVGQIYERALQLARRVEDRTQLSFALTGAWVFHTVRGELAISMHLAEQLYEFAESEENRPLTIAAMFELGCNLVHLGRFAEAHQHIEQTLTAYGRVPVNALALFAGPDLGVFCESYLAQLVWHEGERERADHWAARAIAAAAGIGNPFSMAIALDYAAMLAVFERDHQRAGELARKAIDVCARHDFGYYGPIAEIIAGWATAAGGDAARGLEELRRGLQRFRATQAELRLPFYHGLLAEVYALNNNYGEALANIATGLAYQNKNGEVWYAADLHRIHGDLLRETGSLTQAKLSYEKSLEAAREMGSTMCMRIASARIGLRTVRTEGG